jgi:16S rRNA (uracil1498-N3)-methyltransferase
VVLDPDPSLPPLPRVLGDAAEALLLVGPEGGFSEAEVSRLGSLGARRASLGACVLRVETAALAAAAVALAR